VLPDLDFVEHGHMLHFKPIAYLGFDAAAPSRFGLVRFLGM
jgi:hypothetical protein